MTPASNCCGWRRTEARNGIIVTLLLNAIGTGLSIYGAPGSIVGPGVLFASITMSWVCVYRYVTIWIMDRSFRGEVVAAILYAVFATYYIIHHM